MKHLRLNHIYLPFLVPIILLASPSLRAASEPTEPQCAFSREYITALEFLRHHKAMSIPEQNAEKTAMTIAQGCTGAAQRFIQITVLLLKAGLTSPNAIDTAMEFANRTDAETEAFSTIFKITFSQDQLDLDLRAALRVSRELTSQLRADVPKIGADFKKLVRFCTDERTLNYPRPECAAFAAQIASLGEHYTDGIADPFIRLFDFLTSGNGPNMTTGQAITLAKEVLQNGPNSTDNFIQAFKYGIASSGLSLENGKAIAFAKQLAASKVTGMDRSIASINSTKSKRKSEE